MKTRSLQLSTFCLAIVLATTSCNKSNGNGNNPEPGAPNTVKGQVVNPQGQPMAGVKVRAVNPTGYNLFAEGYTDANGKYSIPISSVGGWTIMAWKEINYKSKTYNLRMGMKNDADYNAFATNGGSITKDFVWKLTGRIIDRNADPVNGTGYFGATMRFVNDNGVVAAMAAGTKVTITLTPTATSKYLDGTTATTPVVKSFTMAAGTSNYYITDIPVTEYRITIESELNGVRKQVYVSGNNYNLLHEWIEFDFDPAGGSGSYESGIMTPNATPFYMAQKP